MDAFDRALLARTAVATLATTGLALAVVVATDEATSTWAMRVARISALMPLVAAVATMGVTAAARQRGELTALLALGASPLGATRAALWAGWAASGIAALALVSPWADPSSLFPVVRATLTWEPHAGGAVARAAGVVVAADGAITLGAGTPMGNSSAPGAASALCIVAPLSFFSPPWATLRLSAAVRALSALAAGALAVTLFHAIAAGRAPLAAGCLAAIPLALAVAAKRSAG